MGVVSENFEQTYTYTHGTTTVTIIILFEALKHKINAYAIMLNIKHMR